MENLRIVRSGDGPIRCEDTWSVKWSRWMWWRGKYQGLRRVVGRAKSFKMRLNLRFHACCRYVELEAVTGNGFDAVEVDRARVWMYSPCVYNLRCENEGATNRCGHLPTE
jgi:hypothetical protein